MPYGYALPGKGSPGNAQRNRITQALLQIQSPPPQMQMPQLPPMRQMGSPQMPPVQAPQPAMQSTAPGSMPSAATGTPGVPSMPSMATAGGVPGAAPGAVSSVMPGAAIVGQLPPQQY